MSVQWSVTAVDPIQPWVPQLLLSFSSNDWKNSCQQTKLQEHRFQNNHTQMLTNSMPQKISWIIGEILRQKVHTKKPVFGSDTHVHVDSDPFETVY